MRPAAISACKVVMLFSVTWYGAAAALSSVAAIMRKKTNHLMAAPKSRCRVELGLQLCGGALEAIGAGRALLEFFGAGQPASQHRIEAGIAHQRLSHLNRLGIIARDRDPHLGIGAVRLA